MPRISIVVPVYGAPKSVDELCLRLSTTLEEIVSDDYEIILVVDGCPYGSWEMVLQAYNRHPNIIGVKLSRNFGQHFAMSAGLDRAKGAVAIMMDCDLQDRPEEIAKLYHHHLSTSADIVFTKSSYRGVQSRFRKLTSTAYYRVYDFLTASAHQSINASFILMSRRAIDAFCSMREGKRQFFSLVDYLGFQTETVEVAHDKRLEGESSYSFVDRMRLAINGILSNSTRILHASVLIGMVFATTTFLYGIFLIMRKLLYPELVVSGWTGVMVAIFFATGLILTFLGVLGAYIETIFWEIKKRPYYIIEEVLEGRAK